MSTESPPSNHLLSLSALLLRCQGRWTQNLTRCDCFALFFLVCVLSLGNNELVIRIQPEEAITLKISNKIPGLGMDLNRTKLNLQYSDDYKEFEFPDAYERLILDAVNGDKRLFIRSDELEAAWDIFTPALHRIDDGELPPELYPYGSRGPVGAHYLASKYGVRWST